MNPVSWHPGAEVMARYGAGRTDPATSLSVEAHLERCDDCRALLRGDSARLERVWADVLDRVDAPTRGPVERLLVRLGLPDHLARLLAATPSLRWSWLAAMAAALSFSVLAARSGAAAASGHLLFLTLAPLLPVAGVAAAYGPPLDPLHETALATPIDGFRLLLLRALAVLASSIALAALAIPFLPLGGWTVAGWLLPAAALTALCLALATRVPPLWASAAVTAAWLGLVVVADRSADRLAMFGPGGQTWFAALLGAACLLAALRRRTYDDRHGGGPR